MILHSDSLFEIDTKKYNRLCMKHFGNEGQWWDQRSKAKTELFLRDYLENDSLKLKKVVETKNESGHPVWEFHI